jgi:hypothetical protein
MPTNLLHTTNSFVQEDVIHASDQGLFSPRSLTVDASKIAPDANLGKVIRPGVVLYKVTGATKHRVGLRTTLDAAVTASSTTVIGLAPFGAVYSSESAQYFADGDVLKVLRPYGTITLVDTWDADDTVLVTIAGQGATYTPGSATLATAATTLAGLINAHPIHSKLVLAIASGPIVYLFSTDLRAHTLTSVATTTGDGAATASGAALQGNITIGTIDASGVSVANGTVTLAAASLVTLPVGAPVGVDGTPWGLVLGAFDASKADTDVTGFTGAAVYGDRLPYWDEDIAANLSQITFV